MKWIEIAKAKPKFNQKYLVTEGETVEVSYLESTKQTAKGLEHVFNGFNIPNPTHIALITLPNEKGVPNE